MHSLTLSIICNRECTIFSWNGFARHLRQFASSLSVIRFRYFCSITDIFSSIKMSRASCLLEILLSINTSLILTFWIIMILKTRWWKNAYDMHLWVIIFLMMSNIIEKKYSALRKWRKNSVNLIVSFYRCKQLMIVFADYICSYRIKIASILWKLKIEYLSVKEPWAEIVLGLLLSILNSKSINHFG